MIVLFFLQTTNRDRDRQEQPLAYLDESIRKPKQILSSLSTTPGQKTTSFTEFAQNGKLDYEGNVGTKETGQEKPLAYLDESIRRPKQIHSSLSSNPGRKTEFTEFAQNGKIDYDDNVGTKETVTATSTLTTTTLSTSTTMGLYMKEQLISDFQV